VKRIERLILGLTYRCQCQCVHCSQGTFPAVRGQELTTAEACAVIDAAAKRPLKEVNLFGGEALLRPDLDRILRHARRHAQHVTLDTNGVGITDAVASRLKATGLNLVYMSLLGANPERCDVLYGRLGMFDEVEASTRALLAAGLPVFYSVCVFRQHLQDGELERILDVARARGVNGVRLLLPICAGEWFLDDSVLLTPSERDHVSRLVDNRFVFVAEGMTEHGFEGCGAVSDGSLFVSPYGDVQPCNFMPILLGNTRVEPLDLILERAERHRFFSPVHQRGCCPMMSPAFLAALRRGLDPATQLVTLEPFAEVSFDAGCTNGCEGCPSRARGTAEPDLAALDARDGWQDIWLRGGEPFLDPRVFEVIGRVVASGHTAGAVTNARVFARAETAVRAAKAGLREVVVPVWGTSPAEYDAHVRVPAGFNHLELGLRNLVRAGVRVTVIVSEAAVDLAESLRQVGVARVLLGPLAATYFCDRSRPLGQMQHPGARALPPLPAAPDEPTAPLRKRQAPRARRGGALVVVPALDAPELAIRAYPADSPVTHFPLAALKLAHLYRVDGYDVHLVDATNLYRGADVPALVMTPERIQRHARCGNFEAEGLTRPVYRLGLTRDQLASALARVPDGVDEVAVTSRFTYEWPTVWEAVQLVRERFPSARIRLGGIYATLMREHALQCGADEVVSGHVPEVAGAWIDTELWRRQGGFGISMKTSYGCNRRCSYCAARKLEGRHAQLEPDDVRRQILHYASLGLRDLHFWDSDILSDRDAFEALLDFLATLRPRLAVRMPSGITLDHFTLPLARRMREAGVRTLSLPLETTNPALLREFHRRDVSARLGRIVTDALEAGFPPESLEVVLLAGFPGQTREDLLRDVAAVVRLGVAASFRMYTPIPGTEDYARLAPSLSGRATEDLDSFLFPMASPSLTVADLEATFRLFHERRLTPGDVARQRDDHPILGDVARLQDG